MSHVPPPPPGAGAPGPDDAKTQKLSAQPGWGAQQGAQGPTAPSDQPGQGQPWQQPTQQWGQPGGPQQAGPQGQQPGAQQPGAQQPWQQQPGQPQPGQQWGQPGAPAQQGPGQQPWSQPGQQPGQQPWAPGQQGGYPGQQGGYPGQQGQQGSPWGPPGQQGAQNPQWGQQQPKKSSRGLLVAIVVAVVVVALAVAAYFVFFSGSTPEALEPDVSSSTSATVGQLVVGNCLEDVSGSGAVGEIDVVPCADDHGAQVVGSTTFTDGDFPGQSTLVTQTTAICSADLVTSGDVPADDLSFVVWTPSEDSWADDDRTGLCVAVVEGGLSGSLLD